MSDWGSSITSIWTNCPYCGRLTREGEEHFCSGPRVDATEYTVTIGQRDDEIVQLLREIRDLLEEIKWKKG